MRWISLIGGILIGAFGGFSLGLILGVGLGHANANIDFCADSTSGRYIESESARRSVC